MENLATDVIRVMEVFSVFRPIFSILFAVNVTDNINDTGSLSSKTHVIIVDTITDYVIDVIIIVDIKLLSSFLPLSSSPKRAWWRC